LIKNTKKPGSVRALTLVATEAGTSASEPATKGTVDNAARPGGGARTAPANATVRAQRQAARRSRQNAREAADQEEEERADGTTPTNAAAGMGKTGPERAAAEAVPVAVPEPVATPVAVPATTRPAGPLARGFGRKRGRAGKADVELAPIIIRPAATAARPRRRHWMMLVSFILLVAVPGALVAAYLWAVAADQYASSVGFSVRSEESSPTPDLLGQLGELSGTNSTDTDILYEFIQSQDMVNRINARLDLTRIYSVHLQQDPVFSHDPEGSIEDLVDYWERMVKIAYDANTGLMEITALAFTPQDAQDIAQAVLDESTLRINELSAIARADTTRYASEELDAALERLREARLAVTEFRMQTQIVDPALDIQGRMGLLNTLQDELAKALIDYDLVRATTREDDPRLRTLERRIEVIRDRITDERARFGAGGEGPGGEDYATLVGEFERLDVDRQFAETAYTAAWAAYDAALLAAQRTSRYLAVHIKPTLAETSRYPQREVIFAVFMLFAFLVWATGALVYYSVRDRR
jgi:capsular polysaccharide transport system permease protein